MGAFLSFDLVSLLIAYVLALPMGWEREQTGRAAGLRTFPLVSIATCAFVIIGTRAFAGDAGAQARIIQGLMTGIGFIGGGAILKQDDRVSGVATASGIWCTGAVGAAVALSEYLVAVTLAAVCWGTLFVFTPLTDRDAEDMRAADDPD